MPRANPSARSRNEKITVSDNELANTAVSGEATDIAYRRGLICRLVGRDLEW